MFLARICQTSDVFDGYLLVSFYRHLVTVLQDRSREKNSVFSVYAAFLVILLVTGNVGGNGDERGDSQIEITENSLFLLKSNHLMFTRAHTHTHTHTHILIAALIFPKWSRG